MQYRYLLDVKDIPVANKSVGRLWVASVLLVI